MKPKVVFIDTLVNINYLMKICDDNIEIAGIFSVEKEHVIKCEPVNKDLTHVTLCFKIFCSIINTNCSIYFINIFNNNSEKTNINNLIIALKWCLENKIDVINLSIGTTTLSDVSKLYSCISKLLKENIIIIAANSNSNKMTFPASFDNIISVKATSNKLGEGYCYNDGRIDKVNIECYVQEESILFNNKFYKIHSSNSYAVPIIAAKVCNYISRGHCDITEVINYLNKKGDIFCNDSYIRNVRAVYCKDISIPVIVLPYIKLSRHNGREKILVIKKIMKQFSEHGYESICLTDDSVSDVSELIFNIEEGKKLSFYEKIAFYSNYCNVDFLMIYIEINYMMKNWKENMFDILLLDDKLNDYIGEKGKYIEKIYMKNFENEVLIFKELYNLLTH